MNADLTLDFSADARQVEMINDRTPMQSWVCGRRWGKTLTARHKMIKWAVEKDRAQVWYVAPTYSKCKAEFRRMAAALPQLSIRKQQQPHPEIELFNGTLLAFRSADRPDNLRGEGVDLVIVDEAAKVDESAFWEVIQPLTADTDGTIVLASTFYGENWFYHEYIKGKDNRTPGVYRSYLYPTYTGIAFQSDAGRARLDRIRATVPSVVWDQEYNCLPSANNDAVFRFIERAIANDLGPQVTANPGAKYVLAWDTGGKEDPSAVGVLEVEPEKDGVDRVAHFEVLPLGMEVQAQLARVATIAKRYGNPLCLVDTTGTHRDWALGFARPALGDVIGCSFQPANKEKMVKDLALAIEQSRVKIPATFNDLISQLKAFRYKQRGNGYDYCAPDGMKDDGVAVLMMLVSNRNYARSGNRTFVAPWL